MLPGDVVAGRGVPGLPRHGNAGGLLLSGLLLSGRAQVSGQPARRALSGHGEREAVGGASVRRDSRLKKGWV